MKLTLKAARVNCGMSVSDACNALGVCRATLGNWESGRSCPSVTVASKLAELYKCSPNDILFFDAGIAK